MSYIGDSEAFSNGVNAPAANSKVVESRIIARRGEYRIIVNFSFGGAGVPVVADYNNYSLMYGNQQRIGTIVAQSFSQIFDKVYLHGGNTVYIYAQNAGTANVLAIAQLIITQLALNEGQIV